MLPLFDTDQQRRMPEDPPYVILHRSGIFEWLTRAKQQGLVNNNSDIFVYYCGDHGTACPILLILLLFCGFHWLESKGKKLQKLDRRSQFSLHGNNLAVDQQLAESLAQVKHLPGSYQEAPVYSRRIYNQIPLLQILMNSTHLNLNISTTNQKLGPQAYLNLRQHENALPRHQPLSPRRARVHDPGRPRQAPRSPGE